MKLRKVELIISFHRHSVAILMSLVSWTAFSLLLWQQRQTDVNPELKTLLFCVLVLNGPVFILAVLPILLLLTLLGVVESPNPFELPGLVLAFAIAPIFWELYESLLVRRYGAPRETPSVAEAGSHSEQSPRHLKDDH